MTRNWLLIAGVFVGLLILANQAKAQNDGIFIYGEIHTIDGDKYEGPIRWAGGETGAEVYWVEMFNAVKTSNDFTKSGRELYMRGTNDVNSGNRGIIVNTDFGRVDIPWREFKKVDFSETAGPALGYNDFENPKKVTGTVLTTKGESISGTLIYDLDEEYDFEMIQGDDDDIEYFIPLKYISKIIPKNYDNSTIVLKSGKEITLGGSRDVSEDNDGIVVLKGSGNDSQYIFWEDIKEITINN